MPAQLSLMCGPSGMRARVGFSPNNAVCAAGMRIEPPPSAAWALGRMPPATADTAPPLEPPVVCARLHGLRHTPSIDDSLVALMPNSDRLVLPKMTRPAFT